ncbi:MAG: type IX secretion system sortase PorU [Chlorobi bacterium]|nr:type IX secretion system sortase PorU [Chlorobiota bacterium]
MTRGFRAAGAWLLAWAFVLSASAQIERSYRLEWTLPARIPPASELSKLSLFSPAHYDKTGRRIVFYDRVPGVSADGGQAEIHDIRYSPFPADWAQALDLPRDTAFVPRIFTLKGRDKISAVIRVNAVIFRKGRWYKLDAFKLRFTPGREAARSVGRVSVSSGPLSEGEWYRFEVDRSGIYKIDKAFLERLGINPASVDPRRIRIFGWGGRMLPLEVDPANPVRLPEVAVRAYGENDGSFDDGDFILFYGVGKDRWNPEYGTHNNLYSEHAYYYLNIGSLRGKRMTPYVPPAGTARTEYDNYIVRRYREIDHLNIFQLGRDWYEEDFNRKGGTLEFTLEFPDINPALPVRYGIKALSDNYTNSRLEVYVNGRPVTNILIYGTGGYRPATMVYRTGTLTLDRPRADVRLVYHDNGYPAARIHLDYLWLEAYVPLEVNGRNFEFAHPGQTGQSEPVIYRLQNASALDEIWDITDPFDADYYVSPGGNAVELKAAPGARRYHTVCLSGEFLTPSVPEHPRVDNQNLSWEMFYPDGSARINPASIVIAPSDFEAQARRLVEIHRQRGLEAVYAPLEKIYLEFGNGMQDIAAIRNFLYYVYTNASSPARRLKYVTLLGDTSWDFMRKQYPDLEENINIIPSYQSSESISLSSSFVTDDFFACMDPGEGVMDLYTSVPDFAVGRLPASTPAQADILTDKFVRYDDPATYGPWHNTVTLVADDADGPDRLWEKAFIESVMDIAAKLQTYHPFINPEKIYLDAYEQVITAGGPRYPGARRDLLNAFETGTLIVGFIGHGNEYSWTHERILNIPEIRSLRNRDKLPLVTTLTCEFGRFDNPVLYSGAEEFVLNPSGGALELITTVREVNAYNAITSNNRLYDYLLGTEGPSFSRFRTPGEALWAIKQDLVSIHYKLALLGDPAVPLHFAQPQIRITAVQGARGDTLRGLQHIRIEGEVTDGSSVLTDFNGTVYPLIFDKEITLRTRNNDRVDGQEYTFKVLGPPIFRGRATVNNGRFAFEFVVPKDINPRFGRAKIDFYGADGRRIRQGVDTSYTVGGIDTSVPPDETPPRIELFMNDYRFADGGITGPDPFLLVNLYDENGINTVGGVGHDITAVLDGRADRTFILNEYYIADENTYKSGKIKFKLYGLEPGEHVIKVRAWDTHNNPAEKELRFRVVEKTDFEITRVLNYPNPFISRTEFWFSHNRPFEPLEVQVEVYALSGELVWMHSRQIQTDGYTSRDIVWDGRDLYGRPIGKGVYIYRITVRTTDGKTAERWEKLVKL